MIREYKDESSAGPRWLINPQIPYGAITVMTSLVDFDKSLVAMNLAALISSGNPLPNGEEVGGGNIIYCSSEGSKVPILTRIASMEGELDLIRVLENYTGANHHRMRDLRSAIEQNPTDLVWL